MAHRPVRRGSAVRNLLLLACSSILILLLAEAALRFGAHLILREGEWINVGEVMDRDDPLLGFSLRPDASRLEISGQRFTRRVSINARGQRDVDHDLPKQQGVKRILVLGDSIMYGWGVDMEDSAPRQLARLVPDAEVINTGVIAYDLGQEYLYFTHRGAAFDPDLVLLGFFVNDVVCYPEVTVTDGPDGLPVAYTRKPELRARDLREAPRNALLGWLRSHSVLYVIVRQRIDDALAARRGRSAKATPRSGSPREGDDPALRPYLVAFRADPPGAVSPEWQRAYRILDRLKRDVEARGARLAIALLPAPWQVSPDDWDRWSAWWGVPRESLSWRKPQDMISAWCAASKTPCHDLLAEFGGGDSSRLFFRGDFHLTAEGHALAAAAIRRFLTDEHLL